MSAIMKSKFNSVSMRTSTPGWFKEIDTKLKVNKQKIAEAKRTNGGENPQINYTKTKMGG